ncbi:MAG: ATP-binding cassette domain-containing protein [Bacillota bacterium]|nr:ATP-binding cassette domain-containing protein [Bacillota bacterium]
MLLSGNNLETINIDELIRKHPYVEEFLSASGIKVADKSVTITELIYGLSDEMIEELGIEREKIIDNLTAFIENMESKENRDKSGVESVTIIGGYNKLGEKEQISITLRKGEIISIVGPTGSGKSRLLGDIECLAQKDTPTGRQILINGEVPEEDIRYRIENKLIAQLSQNMNFIMDVTAAEFIRRHAASRGVKNVEEIITSIIDCANELAGEKFTDEVPITQLSGGQSRALMIADTALLSKSPIVLIDEIENAGVDRKKALELLVKSEKIVLMSTHDPILALISDKRIVIKNGGMDKIVYTDEIEKQNLDMLSVFDNKMMLLREMLRNGGNIHLDIKSYMSLYE